MALGKVASYIKNLGKSMAYASVDVLKSEDMMPVAMAITEENSEVAKEVYHAVKDFRGTVKKVATYTKNTKLYEAASYGISNILEDLSTGNFYNKEREESLGQKISDEMGANDISFGDDDSFNDLDKMFEGDNFDSLDAGSKATVRSIEGTSKASANTIANATISGAKYQAEVSKVNTNLLFAQQERLFGRIHSGISTVNDNVNIINKFNSEVIQRHVENSTKFFDAINKNSNEMNAMFKEFLTMYRNEYKMREKASIANDKATALKTTRDEDEPMTYEDLLTGGALNLSKYRKHVSAQFYKQINSTIGTDGFGPKAENGKMLKMFAVNPLGMLMSGIFKGLIGPELKHGMQYFDKMLSGAFGTAMAKMNNWVNDYESDFAPLKRFIGGVFGTKELSSNIKKSMDTSKYAKGAIPFDGITKKAITEVIPELLGDILAELSNGEHRRFDYDRGKWTSLENIKKSEYYKQRVVAENAIRPYSKVLRNSDKLAEIFPDEYERLQFLKNTLPAFENYLETNNGYVNLKKLSSMNPKSKGFSELRKAMTDNGLVDDAKFKQLITVLANNIPKVDQMQNAGKFLSAKHAHALLMKSNEVNPLDVTHYAYNNATDYMSTVRGLTSRNGKLEIRKSAAIDYRGNSLRNAKYNLMIEVDDKGNNIFNYLSSINENLWNFYETAVDYFNLGDGGGISKGKYRSKKPGKQFTLKERSKMIRIRNNSEYEDYLIKEEKLNNKIVKKAKAKNINAGKIFEEITHRITEGASEEDFVKTYDNVLEELGIDPRSEFAEVYFKEILHRWRKDNVPSESTKEEYGEGNMWYNLFRGKQARDDLRHHLTEKDADFDWDKFEKQSFSERFRSVDNLTDKYNVVMMQIGNMIEAPAHKMYQVFTAAGDSIYDFFFNEDTEYVDKDGKPIHGFFDLIKAKTVNALDTIVSGIDEHIWQPMKEMMGLNAKSISEALGLDWLKDKYGRATKNAFSRLGDQINGLLFGGVTKNTKTDDEAIAKLADALDKNNAATNAKGARMIKKSGLTAISKGEMIIPSEYNPFYSGSTDKASEIANENNIRNGLGKYIASKIGMNAEGNVTVAEEAKAPTNKEAIIASLETLRRTNKREYNRIMDRFNSIEGGDPNEIYDDIRTTLAKSDKLNKEKEDEHLKHLALQGQGSLLQRVTSGIQSQMNKIVINTKNSKVMSIWDDFVKNDADTVGNGVAGGSIGALVGLLTGFGPLAGLVVGAGANIVMGSESVKSFLFGTRDSVTGERDNSGMLLNASEYKYLTKLIPDIGKFGAIGGAAGLVGLAPFGILGGIGIGTMAAFAKNNSSFYEYMFGDADGLINADRKKFLKKAMPNMAIGSLATFALGPFGLLGSMIVGSGLGMLSATEKFKSFLLGDKIEGTDKRSGGAIKVLNDTFISPLASFAKDFTVNVSKAVYDEIIKPFAQGIGPMVRLTGIGIKNAATGILDIAKKAFGLTGDGSGSFLRDIWTKIKPMIGGTGSIGGGLARGVAKLAMPILSAPSKLVKKGGDAANKFMINRGYSAGMTAQDRIAERERGQYGYTGKAAIHSLNDIALTEIDDDSLVKVENAIRFLKSGGKSTEKKFVENKDKLKTSFRELLGVTNLTGEQDRMIENLLSGDQYVQADADDTLAKMLDDKGFKDEKGRKRISDLIKTMRIQKQSMHDLDNGGKDAARKVLADAGLDFSDLSKGLDLVTGEVGHRNIFGKMENIAELATPAAKQLTATEQVGETISKMTETVGEKINNTLNLNSEQTLTYLRLISDQLANPEKYQQQKNKFSQALKEVDDQYKSASDEEASIDEQIKLLNSSSDDFGNKSDQIATLVQKKKELIQTRENLNKRRDFTLLQKRYMNMGLDLSGSEEAHMEDELSMHTDIESIMQDGNRSGRLTDADRWKLHKADLNDDLKKRIQTLKESNLWTNSFNTILSLDDSKLPVITEAGKLYKKHAKSGRKWALNDALAFNTDELKLVDKLMSAKRAGSEESLLSTDLDWYAGNKSNLKTFESAVEYYNNQKDPAMQSSIGQTIRNAVSNGANADSIFKVAAFKGKMSNVQAAMKATGGDISKSNIETVINPETGKPMQYTRSTDGSLTPFDAEAIEWEREEKKRERQEAKAKDPFGFDADADVERQKRWNTKKWNAKQIAKSAGGIFGNLGGLLGSIFGPLFGTSGKILLGATAGGWLFNKIPGMADMLTNAVTKGAELLTTAAGHVFKYVVDHAEDIAEGLFKMIKAGFMGIAKVVFGFDKTDEELQNEGVIIKDGKYYANQQMSDLGIAMDEKEIAMKRNRKSVFSRVADTFSEANGWGKAGMIGGGLLAGTRFYRGGKAMANSMMNYYANNAAWMGRVKDSVKGTYKAVTNSFSANNGRTLKLATDAAKQAGNIAGNVGKKVVSNVGKSAVEAAANAGGNSSKVIQNLLKKVKDLPFVKTLSEKAFKLVVKHIEKAAIKVMTKMAVASIPVVGQIIYAGFALYKAWDGFKNTQEYFDEAGIIPPDGKLEPGSMGRVICGILAAMDEMMFGLLPVSLILQNIPVELLYSDIWDNIKEAATNTWNKAKEIGSAAWEKTKNAGSMVLAGARTAWDATKTLGGMAWDKTKEFGMNLWNDARKRDMLGFAKFSERAKEFGNLIFDTVKNAIPDIGKSILDGITKIGEYIKEHTVDLIPELWGKIKSGVSGFFSNLFGSSKTESTDKPKQSAFDNITRIDPKFAQQFEAVKADLGVDTFDEYVDKHKAHFPDPVQASLMARRGVQVLASKKAAQSKQTAGQGKYGRGYFKQTDPRFANTRFNATGDTKYQTIGDSGCGPIAAVNALYGTGPDPVEASEFALKNGYKEVNGGTKPGFFKSYFNRNGADAEYLNDSRGILKNLAAGNKVVIEGQSNKLDSDTPFGTGPHYVTATGLDHNGNMIIQDPQDHRSNLAFDANKVLSKTKFGVAAKGKYGRGEDDMFGSIIKNSVKGVLNSTAKLFGFSSTDDTRKVSISKGSGNYINTTNGSNLARAWAFFKEKGFCDEAIAGILGNFVQESTASLDPTIHEGFKNLGPKPVPGHGFGIAQWTWKERQEPLMEYANKHNVPVNTLDPQLNFAYKEMEDGGPYYNFDLKKYEKSVGDPGKYAYLFHKEFEGSADSEENVRKNRGSFADQVYAQFKNTKAGTYGAGKYGRGDDTEVLDSIVHSTISKALNGIAGIAGFKTLDDKNDGPKSEKDKVISLENAVRNANRQAQEIDNNIDSSSIQHALAWAKSRVNSQGYGNNGCTAFVNKFLEKANNSKQGWMWVPNIALDAGANNIFKKGTEAAKPGDIALIETNAKPWDGADHVVIATGDGNYIGNSSSTNKIKKGNLGSDFGAKNIIGYVTTGDPSSKGAVASGELKRSIDEVIGDSGPSAQTSETGKGKFKHNASVDQFIYGNDSNYGRGPEEVYSNYSKNSDKYNESKIIDYTEYLQQIAALLSEIVINTKGGTEISSQNREALNKIVKQTANILNKRKTNAGGVGRIGANTTLEETQDMIDSMYQLAQR